MGDRVSFIFRFYEKIPIILYSHYGYSTWKDDLDRIMNLTKVKSRISMKDYEYTIRIIISELIGNRWADETGFGLYASPSVTMEYQSPIVEIDIPTGVYFLTQKKEELQNA